MTIGYTRIQLRVTKQKHWIYSPEGYDYSCVYVNCIVSMSNVVISFWTINSMYLLCDSWLYPGVTNCHKLLLCHTHFQTLPFIPWHTHTYTTPTFWTRGDKFLEPSMVLILYNCQVFSSFLQYFFHSCNSCINRLLTCNYFHTSQGKWQQLTPLKEHNHHPKVSMSIIKCDLIPCLIYYVYQGFIVNTWRINRCILLSVFR